eukprot:1156514-Pelagomonas_calceolata.AAC.2
MHRSIFVWECAFGQPCLRNDVWNFQGGFIKGRIGTMYIVHLVTMFGCRGADRPQSLNGAPLEAVFPLSSAWHGCCAALTLPHTPQPQPSPHQAAPKLTCNHTEQPPEMDAALLSPRLTILRHNHHHIKQLLHMKRSRASVIVSTLHV